MTRRALSELVNEKTGISVEMAIRRSKAFGSSPEAWLGMQMAHDLWQARTMAATQIRRFRAGWSATGGCPHIRPFQGTRARSMRRIGRPRPARQTESSDLTGVD